MSGHTRVGNIMFQTDIDFCFGEKYYISIRDENTGDVKKVEDEKIISKALADLHPEDLIDFKQSYRETVIQNLRNAYENYQLIEDGGIATCEHCHHDILQKNDAMISNGHILHSSCFCDWVDERLKGK